MQYSLIFRYEYFGGEKWKFAGAFQDDPDFQEIMDGIRAERTSSVS